MTEDYAIIGLQFGSEGKGALAGYLANMRQPKACVAAWAPNAGHTFKWGSGPDDKTIVVRQIPIAAFVSKKMKYALIGPGSVIDPLLLSSEASLLPPDVRLIIHPAAAIVGDNDAADEKAYARIGSTMKGAAAASIRRMHRDPEDDATAGQYYKNAKLSLNRQSVYVDADYYNDVISDDNIPIQVEGCQGHSLSMYHGMYPYTTSRDVSIHQLKADIGWHARRGLAVYGCARTFPIRVSNRPEGTSGPCYADQMELDWTVDLMRNPELTTVTKLPRRIFTFSRIQIQEAISRNGVDAVYLSFIDYCQKDPWHKALPVIKNAILETGTDIRWQSNGPLLANMVLLQ